MIRDVIRKANSRLLLASALLTGLLPSPLLAGAEEVDFGSRTLDATALDRFRGGTDVAVDNTNTTDGLVHGNNASNLVTGSNLIDASFSGASGLSTVIQNTGNNVLIQAPVIVNLQVQ
ncbi:MAG TPA: hypothetical protein VFF03_05820 [Rhodocyclaceae bacterium]|nr:hypothetical protein [Rhodocyclaceae bacterium]